MLRISNLILTLFLFILTSSTITYALPNKWCSNGKYSASIIPFPKQSLKKCPVYAKIIMSLDDVKDYYFEGLGKEFLCKKIENGDLFKQNQKETYKALIEMIKGKDLGCENINYEIQPNTTGTSKDILKLGTKDEKQKEWCIGAGQFGKKYPIKKRNGCPTHAGIEITESEALKILLSGTGQKYLSDLIKSGAICQNDKTEYKFLRKLLSGKIDLGCQQNKTLAEKKAEEEAKIKALAEKLAKEEIAKQLKQKEEQRKKTEELAKQKALAKKKAKEEARKKALAKKKAEELAKQKALAKKKAKEEARKKALAKKKAEELAKQKAEEEALKQKVLNEKIAKIKDEAQFIVETLKEYVTTDKNKLDILEVSELLDNYDDEKQKGWSDTAIEKYEALYDYVKKDEGFVTYSSEKKSKELAAYNEEIRLLREYLSSSQSSLKEFITINLGSKNAKDALKLAKETKAILNDFDVSKAVSLKNNIATWKAMNGVKEDKKYVFKILNKKLGFKNIKKSSTKASSSLYSSKALNTSPIVNKGDNGKFEKEYKRSKKQINQNKSNLKVGDFPEFLIGKTWFPSSIHNRSRLSCNEVYRKVKNVIGYTRYERKNLYSYIRSKNSSIRPMDSEFKAEIVVIETGNKTKFKVVSQGFYPKDGMCYSTSIKEYDPSKETLKNIGCSSAYCSVTGNNNRLNKTRCLFKGNILNYCFGYPSR